jgi:processed acidic surface protein
MSYLKVMLFGLLTFPFLFPVPSQAAPPENELNQYLAEIGWTKQEFMDYLDYYEIPIDDFNTVEELKEILGTPINSKNFLEMLTKYDLTEQQFNELMDHFGDSKNDYTFIEDLDASVEFYVNYDEYMAETELALEEFGITEEESERFFNYLSMVEEKNKDQLDQIAANDTMWEKFLTVEDPSQISDEDLDEMVRILEEIIALYEVKVNYQVDGKAITLKELFKLQEPPSSLSASVFDVSGNLLIDFTIPKDFFKSLEVIDDAEDMLHLGEISDDYVDHMHEEKYDDAQKGLK